MRNLILLTFLLIIFTCGFSSVEAQNVVLDMTAPTTYEPLIGGAPIEDGAITEHRVYCDNNPAIVLPWPQLLITVDFPPGSHRCYYTALAHGRESDPSATYSFVVEWPKPNPPINNNTDDSPTDTAALLSWTAPTKNTDESDLTDLASFKVYYGRDEDNLDTIADVNSPTTEKILIEDLTPNTYFFSVAAVNESGVESGKTVPVSKVIN